MLRVFTTLVLAGCIGAACDGAAPLALVLSTCVDNARGTPSDLERSLWLDVVVETLREPSGGDERQRRFGLPPDASRQLPPSPRASVTMLSATSRPASSQSPTPRDGERQVSAHPGWLPSHLPAISERQAVDKRTRVVALVCNDISLGRQLHFCNNYGAWLGVWPMTAKLELLLVEDDAYLVRAWRRTLARKDWHIEVAIAQRQLSDHGFRAHSRTSASSAPRTCSGVRRPFR